MSKLLLVNGNSSLEITAQLVAQAHAFLGAGHQVVGATAASAPAYIASRASAAVAAQAVLETVKAEVARAAPERFDACVLACFGEPGIGAVREIAACPVVGMAEASIVTALQLGERFAIVTAGERWPSMLRELMRQVALDGRAAGIVTVKGDALALARDPDFALTAVEEAARQAVEALGADVLIVGGAALAGLVPRLRARFAVPLVDSFRAALAQALALAAVQG